MKRLHPFIHPLVAAALLLAGGDAQAQTRCAAPVAGKMTRCAVANATTRKAVCNDGSPAVFYVEAGRGAGRDKWVVYLQGGGSGRNIPDLWKRWYTDTAHMSSRGYPAAVPGEGILSGAAQNPFGTWNRVYVRYCSSDTHIGDGEAKSYLPAGSVKGIPNPTTWQFRGKRIVRAVFEDLARGVPGLPKLSTATALVFGGGSAGAGGARQNIDAIAAYVQGLDASRTVKIRGFIDSAFSPVSNLTPLLDRRRTAEAARESAWVVNLLGATLAADLLAQNPLDLWNATMDASCVAAKGRDACRAWDTLLAYIETPIFMFMDLVDSNGLRHMGVRLPNIATSEDLQVVVDYATKVAEALAAHLDATPRTGSSSASRATTCPGETTAASGA